MAFALPYHAIAVKRARKGTLLGSANESTEKFCPLKVALAAIPAFFANRKVRLWSPAHSSPSTNASLGNRRCREQDQDTPLSYSYIGRAFQFPSG